jgi:hypothetical protein
MVTFSNRTNQQIAGYPDKLKTLLGNIGKLDEGRKIDYSINGVRVQRFPANRSDSFRRTLVMLLELVVKYAETELSNPNNNWSSIGDDIGLKFKSVLDLVNEDSLGYIVNDKKSCIRPIVRDLLRIYASADGM